MDLVRISRYDLEMSKSNESFDNLVTSPKNGLLVRHFIMVFALYTKRARVNWIFCWDSIVFSYSVSSKQIDPVALIVSFYIA
jgi:hypothetical protein